jgi:hypothetical protein
MAMKFLVKNIVEEKIEEFKTTSEIVNIIISVYLPDFAGNTREITQLKTLVSNILSRWKRGVFGPSDIESYQFSNSRKDTVWGHKEWIGEDGKPKEGYFKHPLNGLEI